MMTYITRRAYFNAAHRMYRDDWTKARNEEIFGKCANLNWHGHNYELFVTVKGEINETTVYPIDLNGLKAIIHEQVVEKLDHKNLNLDVDFLQGKMATTEILCIEIFKCLKEPIERHQGVFLHSVKLHETENNAVEYFGE